MSQIEVNKINPATGTTLTVGDSGDTVSIPSGATLDISASTLTPPATMPASSAANLTNIPGANITGTIAAVSGANLTSLTATNLSSGTVPTARLGTGTASSSTVLYGDQTYKAAPGGNYSVHAFGQYDEADQVLSTTTGRVVITDQDFSFTPTSTSDIFTFFGHCLCYISASAGAGLILTYSTDDFAHITEGFNQGDGANHCAAGDEPIQQNIYIECKVTGLTADTAYKFRLYAQQLSTDNTYYNYLSGTPASAQAEHSLMGIHYKYEG